MRKNKVYIITGIFSHETQAKFFNKRNKTNLYVDNGERRMYFVGRWWGKHRIKT
jgi:hypothetical protein